MSTNSTPFYICRFCGKRDHEIYLLPSCRDCGSTSAVPATPANALNILENCKCWWGPASITFCDSCASARDLYNSAS